MNVSDTASAEPDRLDSDFDLELLAQRLALQDTAAWDSVYAQATARARTTGFAQVVLERGVADYDLVDGSDPQALRLDRLAGAKVHLVMDWP